MSFAGGLKKRIRTDGPVATALVQSVVKGVFWYHNEQCQVVLHVNIVLFFYIMM